MSDLSSVFLDAKNRSKRVSPQSGMCAFCTEDCNGTCELGMAAVLGSQTVYPTNTGNNQIGSEKDYAIDYSHFNINGRVFGAVGIDNPTSENTTIFNVNLKSEYGVYHKVKIELPFLLPALIKLNWKDYFAGAAMAGVSCVIGEEARNKDCDLKIEDGKIKEFSMLGEMLDSFRDYYRGYGQIIIQCNVEDDMMELPEYAILNHGAEAIEFKFGQSAKGTQPARKLSGYKEACKVLESGYIVYPNPKDEKIKKYCEEGLCPNFYSYARLPMWDEKYFVKRISKLRDLGLKNVYFKMAGYDENDIKEVLKIASAAKVDMITFDGAGGGSGYSPCKMINEWSYPCVMLQKIINDVIKQMPKDEYIPAITLTGGFASEDQVFKALAMGDRNINAIGLCRASMAAAMSAKKIGEMINSSNTPEYLKKYGNSVEEIFGDLPDLKMIYGKEAEKFSPGAIGVFSYLKKIAFGLQHFGALNRKFDLKYFDKTDLIALTPMAKQLLK